MNIILAILIFSSIIAIHEFGHFLAAKFFKIGVVEYSIGMGPLLIGKRIGETFYALRAIPFGGYCAMYGEESLEANEKGSNKEEKELKEEPSGWKFLGKKPNYKLDFDKSQSFSDQKPWKKIIVFIAGPFFNIVLGFVACLISICIWGANEPLVVTEIMENSSAEEQGVEVGDLIIAINDRKVLTFGDYQEYKLTHAKQCENGYSVTVDRNGESIVFDLVPSLLYDEISGEELPLVGLKIQNNIEKKNFVDTIKYSFNDTKYWVTTVIDSIGMLARGEAKATDLTGAIGITNMVGESIDSAKEYGNSAIVETILMLIALISINLGVMNMLPFPALDGGRTCMTFFELITTKKVPTKIEFAVNAIGMLCLIALMVFTVFNDIIRIMNL